MFESFSAFFSDSQMHSALLFTMAHYPIIIAPEAISGHLQLPVPFADESQDYLSQTVHCWADAADVSNPCLDIIVGAAVLLKMNIVHFKYSRLDWN